MSAPLDLIGAVDMHAHFGPDAHLARSFSAVETVQAAQDADFDAVVLKSHDAPTANLAAALSEFFDISVLGGICLDTSVGGINPEAAEDCLRIGGKIVWLPTLTSAVDWDRYGRQMGRSGPGLRLCSEDGVLSAATQEVIELVCEHDAVLATGHVSVEEQLAVASAMPRGGRLLVTHALEGLAGPTMTTAFLSQMVLYGAMIEFCAFTCMNSVAPRGVDEIAHAMMTVSSDNCVIASDLGQPGNDAPARGLLNFAERLSSCGLSATQIRTMAVDNPRRMLAL